jgi:phospholipase/carboxylesterase
MRPSVAILVLAGVVLATGGMARQERVPRLSALTMGGKGPPTVVLLHGYCSSENDWVPFARNLHLPPTTRFVFPQGPGRAKRTDGAPDGRAWWPLRLSLGLREGVLGADLSERKPAGIERAAKAVRALLVREGKRSRHPILLGGFSQGAMVAGQVAFLSDQPLQALVLLSGTIVDGTLWSANYARRKGLRVFIAHGRTDPTLSFDTAERMRGEMTDAGLQVTWFPFDGGHETPSAVVAALNEFLAGL